MMGLSRGKMPICGLGNKPGCLGGGSGHNCRGFSLTTMDTLHVCAASPIQLCKNPVDGSMSVHLMPSASGIAEAASARECMRENCPGSELDRLEHAVHVAGTQSAAFRNRFAANDPMQRQIVTHGPRIDSSQ